MKTMSLVAPFLLSTFLVAPAASAAGIIKFDAPGAGTASGQGTLAYRINSSSEIAGYYIDSSNNYHGFLRSPDGTFKTFDAKGASTWSLAINDHGAIGGTYDVLLGKRDSSNGFVRTARGRIETINPRGNHWGAVVYGINLGGESTGSYVDADDVIHGYFRTKDAALTAFDAPGAAGTYVHGINDGGAIVGWYMDAGYVDHGYVRAADGTFTEFDAPGAGSHGTLAHAINGKGWIVGDYDDPNLVSHGYLRDPGGTFTEYDAPDAGKGAQQGTGGAGGVNSHGNVTGAYYDSGNAEHGYIRLKDGSLTEFDAPDAAGLTAPGGINESNIIAGYYADSAGVYHGFLRTP